MNVVGGGSGSGSIPLFSFYYFLDKELTSLYSVLVLLLFGVFCSFRLKTWSLNLQLTNLVSCFCFLYKQN